MVRLIKESNSSPMLKELKMELQKAMDNNEIPNYIIQDAICVNLGGGEVIMITDDDNSGSLYVSEPDAYYSPQTVSDVVHQITDSWK